MRIFRIIANNQKKCPREINHMTYILYTKILVLMSDIHVQMHENAKREKENKRNTYPGRIGQAYEMGARV